MTKRIAISLYWKCQMIGWGLFALVPHAFLILSRPQMVKFDSWLSIFLIIINVSVIGILVSHLLRITIKRTGILKKTISRQFFYGFFLTIVFSFIYLLLLNITIGMLQGRNGLIIYLQFYVIVFQGLIFAGAFLIWSLIYFVVHYINDIRKQEQEKMHLKIHMLETEGKALRAQMNPHFIFNCLSSINHFIIQNETEKASDYLTRFSRLIRMVLNYSQKKLISLEDELEMLRLYLDMERLRFKDSFEYTIIYNKKIDAGAIFIPPLLFQPFAENAIWHGLMDKKGEGRLIIEVNSGGEEVIRCTITDNGIGRKKAADLKEQVSAQRKSVGIQITKQRIALLYGEEGKEDFYEVQDLVDENGDSAGTKVVLKIKYSKFMEETEEY